MIGMITGFGRLFGLIFVLSSPSFDRAENQDVNRLKNPGFEYRATDDGSYGDKPEYWTKYSASGSFSVTDSYKKDGEQGLEIADTSASLSAGMLSDPVSVNPGCVYTARAWMMRSASAASGALYLRFYDSAGQQLFESIQNGGTIGAWGAVELTAVAPANAAFARILLYSSRESIGSLYFDSASLVLADEEVWDGGFGSASLGTLPENWNIGYTHAGATQAVYDDGGNRVIRLTDTSSSAACGVYRSLPVTPGTPYRLSADVSALSCSANMDLKFCSSSGVQLSGYTVSTTSSTCTNLVLEKTAPSDAAYANAFLSIPLDDVGTADFDNISFTENYTVKYAAPVAAGNGSGSSVSNAALYTSSAFWSGVRTRLDTDPVKVVLLKGDYTKYLGVGSVGNETNHLLICGETPYAVNYSDETNTNENYFLYFSGCTNVTLRHINFTAEEDPARLALKDHTVYDYRGVLCLNRSVDISLEGLTFTDLLMMSASASSVWAGSHDITWKNCSYVNIGWDLYDHCIYNTSLAYNLNVEDCYFQDCNGVYVRYRSGSTGSVTGNTFISTGTQLTGDPNDRRHWSFVQVCALNNGSSDEILSDHLVVSNNSFRFENTLERGFRAPFWIYAQGPAPTNHPDWHLVPPETGAIIEDTTASVTVRNAYIQQYFGIDLINNYLITNNTYLGCWPVLFMMTSEPSDRETYWTNLPSETPTNNCDLDALVGLD